MFNRILLTVITTLLLAQGAIAQSWQGTWSTDFGELRLYKVGNYVVGDYGSQGLMLGEIKFDLLQGVFTNPSKKKSGHFTFQSVGNDKFRGSYKWSKDGKVTDWNGAKTSTAVPRLQNFSNVSFTPQSESSGKYDGDYDTSFGRIKLLSQDQILIGDYGTKGVLIGGWDRNNFSGHFTNNGRLGEFRFYFNPSTGAFLRGEWAWVPKDLGGAWNLKKINNTRPKLTQVVLPSSSTTASVNAEHKPVSKPQSRPALKTLPWTLYPGARFDLNKAETMAGMQQHIQWISQAEEEDVIDSLEAAGYKVENNRQLITSRLDGELLLLNPTTNRLRSYVAVRGNDVVVCFRGSKAARARKKDGSGFKTFLNGLVTDGNVRAIPLAFLNRSSQSLGPALQQKVHAGFNLSYTRLHSRILDALKKHKGKNVYVFGHSLGAAQATLCGLDIALNLPNHFANETVIVSGSPRVGDANFKRFYEAKVPNMYRIEIAGDPVPMIPPSISVNLYTYIHTGDLVHIDGQGNLIEPAKISKKLKDFAGSNHDNQYYFDAAHNFWEKAKAPGYFNGKADYTRRANVAEREQSLNSRLIKKLQFWK